MLAHPLQSVFLLHEVILMNILSLFDGMACGMLAMLKAEIQVDSYYAYEIDKYAIQTVTHNFPQIQERGDVFKGDYIQYKGIDYLIGGSICTYWSIAQSPKRRETTASGIGWDMFSQYVRALKEAEPKYFIYENNKSMANAIRQAITKTFGFEPICINSALVSAQNRQRLYWVGKRNADGTYSKVDVQQPEDRGILLKDVLDGFAIKEKSPCIDANYYKGGNYTNVKKQSEQRMCCAEPVNTTIEGKSQTLKAQYSNTNATNICCYKSTYGASGVAEPVACRCRGRTTKGGKGYAKSVTQSAQDGGMGAKTGLYAVPVEFDGDIPIKAVSGADGKTYTVYEVKDGTITIKGKTYPIKLIDGYYIIRKLTVSECKRLQTVPEWYEFPVSNTQAYKMLGNGWTVDVIAHLIEMMMNGNRLK